MSCSNHAAAYRKIVIPESFQGRQINTFVNKPSVFFNGEVTRSRDSIVMHIMCSDRAVINAVHQLSIHSLGGGNREPLGHGKLLKQ